MPKPSQCIFLHFLTLIIIFGVLPDLPTPLPPTTAIFNVFLYFLEKLLRKLNGEDLAGGVLGDDLVDMVQVSVITVA